MRALPSLRVPDVEFHYPYNLEFPDELRLAVRRAGVRFSRYVLSVSVRAQRMYLYERRAPDEFFPLYGLNQRFVVSTSAFGVGQKENSHQTPLGLHRVARKIGGGHMIGTVFRSRVPVGLTWQGMPDGGIAHRILWLEGLESGKNLGGHVDSFSRYIYIHGFGDELTLGRPASKGCIHMAAKDLIQLYDLVPEGTLVWIAER
jgi:lipoprotein-anchoring transpeptidase ErfK/SrfK